MNISINVTSVRHWWGAGLSARDRNMRSMAALLADPRRDPSCRRYRFHVIRFDHICHPLVREAHARVVQHIVTCAQIIENHAARESEPGQLPERAALLAAGGSWPDCVSPPTARAVVRLRR